MPAFFLRPSECASPRFVVSFTALATGVLLATAGLARADDTPNDTSKTETLAPVDVKAATLSPLNTPTPPTYAGGQVATGGQVGVLGNQDIMETPFNQTSYTDKLIQDQQAQTLGDVVKNDPSVQVSNGFSNQAETFVIRGFPLYGDDLAFNGLYGILPRQIVPADLAGRVEIFKGPSAFLNGVPPGGTGVGGSINIQPKRAGDQPLTRLGLEYTSDNQVGGKLDIGRRFGADQQFGVRLNAATRNGDTAVDDEHQAYRFASLGLDYRGDRLRASMDLGYQRQRFDQPRPTVSLAGGAAVPDAPDSATNYGQPYTFSNLKTTFGMGRVEYDFSDNVMGYLAIGGNDNEEHGAYTSPTVDGSGQSGAETYLDVPYLSQTFSSAAGLRGLFHTGGVSHKWNIAVSNLHFQKRTAYTFGLGLPATNLYDPVDAQKSDAGTVLIGGDMDHPGTTQRERLSGAALSDTLGFLNDRLLVTLGTRYQEFHIKNYDYSGNRSDTYNKNNLSPLYAVLFKLTNSVSLYANHIEGLTQRSSAPDNVQNNDQTFAPGRAEQNEIGVKLDRYRYGATLAAFQIEQPSPNGYTDQASNTFSHSRQRNRGLELNLYGTPFTGLHVIGGATYIKSKLTKTDQGTDDGNNATGVPEYQLTGTLTWDLPWIANSSVTSTVVHTASQYVDEDNAQKIPDWTRVDLGARYSSHIQGRKVIWRAGVDNVFDKDYWASANGGYLTQGDPRVFKVSVDVDL